MRRIALMACGAMLASPAGATWWEARTNHFIVYSEGSEASVRDFSTRLEQFDRGMRRLRNLPDQKARRANPLTVYVLSDVAAVQRLCNGVRGAKTSCNNVAGFYDGRAGGSVAFTPRRSGGGGLLDLNAQTVLFHEYTHHLMLENYSAAYPAWFVEGFAEFNSTASFDKDGTLGFGKPAFHRYYGLLTGKPLPLAAMLVPDNRQMSEEQREAMYGRGWLLTHYLTFDKQRSGQLSAYLGAINQGKPSKVAADGAFGDIGKLDDELDKYLHQTALSYIRLTSDAVPAGTVTVRMLGPGEAAIMPVRLRSRRGVDSTAAARVVLDARRLAAPFPTDPTVQDALAEAEYDAGNDEPCEAASDRALAADPKDRTAMMYKGRVHIRRAAKAKAKTDDAALWKEARSWFVKANRLEPDDAAPLLLFYQSFIEQKAKPTANAVTGLEFAFQLAPQDNGLQWLLARQYLLDDRTKEARATLAPLAFDPHAPPDNPAATLVTLIDKGDTKAIVARLQNASEPES